MTALVSVIIPTAGQRDLAPTVSSALAQAEAEVEVVVVFDGEPTLRPLIPEDARVHTVRLPARSGVSAARNAGIAKAAGAWLAFLDDDDLWAPDKLAGQLKVADGHAGFAYSAAAWVDGRLRPIATFPPPSPSQLRTVLRRYNAIPAGGSNVIVRREVIDSVGLFDESLLLLSDWDMWVRLAAATPAAADPRPVVAYVRHEAAESASAADRHRAELDTIAARHGLEPDRGKFAAWLAGGQARSGRRGAAARLYLQAAWQERSPVHALRAARVITGLPSPRRRPRISWLAEAR